MGASGLTSWGSAEDMVDLSVIRGPLATDPISRSYWILCPGDLSFADNPGPPPSKTESSWMLAGQCQLGIQLNVT